MVFLFIIITESTGNPIRTANSQMIRVGWGGAYTYRRTKVIKLQHQIHKKDRDPYELQFVKFLVFGFWLLACLRYVEATRIHEYDFELRAVRKKKDSTPYLRILKAESQLRTMTQVSTDIRDRWIIYQVVSQKRGKRSAPEPWNYLKPYVPVHGTSMDIIGRDHLHMWVSANLGNFPSLQPREVGMSQRQSLRKFPKAEEYVLKVGTWHHVWLAQTNESPNNCTF